MSEFKTHTCNEISLEDVGKKVGIAGFVETIRDLGGLVFLDIRDMYGITQVVTSMESQDVDIVSHIPIESSVTVYGTVRKRSEETRNPKLKTGEVEIYIEEIKVLGKRTANLPFEVNSNQEVREDVRLKYRYLDLRSQKLQNNLKLRAEVLQFLRAQMVEQGFLEVQTPILTSSSPEGARDYLVPSRLHPGKFYALPQAPQQFKQLLMVSGFNKYYQIAPCFRDEDPRADRAPGEFYQLDFEMAFSTQEDVFKVIEDVVPYVFKKFTDWKVDEGEFIKIPYKEAMEKYGIDKPDLRNPLIIQDVTSLFENTEFNAFKDKTIKVIIVPEGANQGRKFFDKMGEFAVEECGAKGLAWTKLNAESELEGGIAKFITPEIVENLKEHYGLKENASMFFIADEFKTAQKIAGLVRIELGKRLDLIEKNVYKFCFIVDFPMYELSDEGTIDFCHNPFSMPQGGMEALENMDPLDILAYQYDLVCNGYEMASGAVRNHNPEIMVKAFEIAGYTEEDVKTKFGALYNAFQYGTPPHAGAAPGIDRMVMLIEDSSNIREVIAFPKNKRARDLLMRAPSKVSEQQLKDVHIKLDLEEK